MIPSRNPKLIILVGPPGSGKSTLAKKYESEGFTRISQDDQGKDGHIVNYMNALTNSDDIVVDRMNFNKQQRGNYLLLANKAGYDTEITVIHESYETCLGRMFKREDHPTIKDEKSARSALQTFFTKYERPEDGEAKEIKFIYPEGPKPKAIICDLDGTLCNVEHRRHHVRRSDGQKKDWKSFFDGIPYDTPNQWCVDLLRGLGSRYEIVYCSGRDDNHRKATVEWLKEHGVASFNTFDWAPLYMRNRHDSRQDSIVKEIILDFELLTRYEPYFMIDDRQQVVDMWRKRGFICLQCDQGDF